MGYYDKVEQVFDSAAEPTTPPAPAPLYSANPYSQQEPKEYHHVKQLSAHSTASAVRRVSRCTSSYGTDSKSMATNEAGHEPGIDYRTTIVDMPDAIGSEITFADYNSERITVSRLDVRVNQVNAEASVDACLRQRPAHSSVRWINVNGLSSEAIGPITKFFGFHPLVVEDMMDIPQRTKLNVFDNYMFACFPLHTLREEEDSRSKATLIKQFFSKLWRVPQVNPSTSTSINQHPYLAYPYVHSSTPDLLAPQPVRQLHQWGAPQRKQITVLPSHWKKRQVGVEQVSMFVTSDTIITFFERAAPRVIEPLMNRMLSGRTILRQTMDPSILAQAIIDTCVDLIAPIINEYSSQLRKLQIEAIECPTLTHTRTLNFLLSELTVLKSSVNSLSGMINSFKARKNRGKSDTKGFQVSETAALYFGDVSDHIMSYVSDLSIMHEQTKQITSLIFNTINIKSSNAVRLLSLVTVVFLPLSFLTGYFGMNFSDFDTLNNNVGYYWCIAGPFTAVLAVLLTYSWVFEKVKAAYTSTRCMYREY